MAGKLPDLILGFAVSLKPDPTALPGTSLGQKAVGGLVTYAMLFFTAVLIVGAGQWAWSGSNNNPVGASAGKRKVGLAIAGFFLIGGGEAILAFAQKMVPIGYEVEAFTPSRARILTWGFTLLGNSSAVEPAAYFGLTHTELIWVRASWRIASTRAGFGPTPRLPTKPGALGAYDMVGLASRLTPYEPVA